jgi:RimJ/RimL family protein N-acetyltransferase
MQRVDPDELVADYAAYDGSDGHQVVAVMGGRAVGTAGVRVSDGLGQTGTEAELVGVEGWLGYAVDPACAGRGIGTALAGDALDAAFGRLGLRRVQAGCFADNTASWRVMEKLGMRREQHGVKDSFHAELGWIDGYTYAILAEEWTGRGD